MNAKEELLSKLKDKPKIKCAKIFNGNIWDEEDDRKEITLKVNHIENDWIVFLNNLDFNYDSGYGGQELFGLVWLEDGAWLERFEYDGSEHWVYKDYPKIPDDLIAVNKQFI